MAKVKSKNREELLAVIQDVKDYLDDGIGVTQYSISIGMLEYYDIYTNHDIWAELRDWLSDNKWLGEGDYYHLFKVDQKKYPKDYWWLYKKNWRKDFKLPDED